MKKSSSKLVFKTDGKPWGDPTFASPPLSFWTKPKKEVRYEILAGNHIIGTYHGWKHVPTPRGAGKGYYNFPAWGKAQYNLDSFKYHTSWEWIMAATCKFLDQYDKKDNRKMCEILRYSLYHANFDGIFQNLCFLIEYFNEQKIK